MLEQSTSATDIFLDIAKNKDIEVIKAYYLSDGIRMIFKYRFDNGNEYEITIKKHLTKEG